MFHFFCFSYRAVTIMCRKDSIWVSSSQLVDLFHERAFSLLIRWQSAMFVRLYRLPFSRIIVDLFQFYNYHRHISQGN